MVWGTERAYRYQRIFLAHQARYGVYLGGLQRFAERQRWQDAGHTFG